MGVPCLDEGSTPSSSTFKLLLKIKLLIINKSAVFCFLYTYYISLFFVQNLRKLWKLKKRILKHNI